MEHQRACRLWWGWCSLSLRPQALPQASAPKTSSLEGTLPPGSLQAQALRQGEGALPLRHEAVASSLGLALQGGSAGSLPEEDNVLQGPGQRPVGTNVRHSLEKWVFLLTFNPAGGTRGLAHTLELLGI